MLKSVEFEKFLRHFPVSLFICVRKYPSKFGTLVEIVTILRLLSMGCRLKACSGMPVEVNLSFFVEVFARNGKDFV